MRFPRQPPRSTPHTALPSILTLFPARQGRTVVSSRTNDSRQLQNISQEGIEVVPIERSNTPCGKTVSPSADEKEVSPLSTTSWAQRVRSKPLPKLPQERNWRRTLKRKWSALSIKKRVLILLGAQASVLVTIGLSIFAINPSRNSR